MADQAAAPAATTAVSPCGGFGGGASTGTGAETGGTSGAAAGGAGGMMGMIFPLAIFVLIFYFFIIRPQRKRQKQHESLIGGISRGDQIITIGGFFGTVREVREDTFLIELAEGVKVRILKSAVQTKKSAPETPSLAEDKAN